ncbi:MAG: rhomboid family intramembrane serine protease [Streptosporangiaceae bacterium]
MAAPPGPSSEPEVSASAPTCFRHPDRETYVSCVRCGRPACPDCLRSAAVGQQCVECIRDGNRGSRSATAPFGGRVTTRPVVTWTLIALNVVIYLIEQINPSKIIAYGGMIGRAFDPVINAGVGVAFGDWYRLISSAFLHEPLTTGFGIFHIVFNMWALYVVGPALEQMLGRVRFLAVYLVSALGGSVLYYLIASPAGTAIGASGAIFGLFGAWFVLARRLHLDARMVVVLIAINLVISFTVSGIAWQDHVGGLIAGSALTAAYVYAPRANRTLIQVAATIVMIGLLIGGVVLRDLQLVSTVVVRV